MTAIPFDPELFRWMVEEAFAEKGLVREFDRLRGTNIMGKGLSPIETLVDGACGKLEHDLKLFVDFVKEFIYDPLVGGYSFAIDLPAGSAR